ncbi:glycosyltransferase family 2 protein [Verrucomicrobiota bacterium]
MSDPRFSVTLPVYCQAGHIAGVVNGYVQLLDEKGLDYELILVVNGPLEDGSLDVCNHLAEANERVRTIHEKHAGWGSAVRTGLRESRGELVCYTNSARTAASDLAAVMRHSLAFSDCVIKATRKSRAGFTRRLGSLLYNLQCRTFFDLPYWDINGTPKLFPRKFSELFKLTEDGDLVDLEFCALCRQELYPIVEWPTLLSHRHSGATTTNLKTALNLYIGAFRMKQRFDIAPHPESNA